MVGSVPMLEEEEYEDMVDLLVVNQSFWYRVVDADRAL